MVSELRSHRNPNVSVHIMKDIKEIIRAASNLSNGQNVLFQHSQLQHISFFPRLQKYEEDADREVAMIEKPL